MRISRSLLLCAAAAIELLAMADARAQWLTETVQLKPGWNAVYLHVDASYISLDNLIPDANSPVSEIWLWKPSYSTLQFIDTPQQPVSPNSQWAVWTASRGDLDTLISLMGNAAYLVRNSSDSIISWSVKGKPLPPDYQWTSTGLNLLGFPTPAGAPPAFDDFLRPAPGLSLANSAINQAQVFRYVGGPLTNNPQEVLSLSAGNVPVNRGEAFWVRGASNYYNHYYGPFEVVLQNTAGIVFGDNVGVYSVRLRNLTDTNRIVTFSQVPSEAPPTGQPALAGTPQLLVRGDRNPTNFSYGYSLLDGSQFALAPQGQVGSDIEVVIGLNRALATGAPGSIYAGIVRIADADGLSQVDIPVSASVPNLAGLWVGDANIRQVGQYLKTYPQFTPLDPAPRASFLTLSGTSNSFGVAAATVPFDSGAFTLESWVFLSSALNDAALASLTVRDAGGNNKTLTIGLAQTTLTPFLDLQADVTTRVLTGASSLPASQWAHIALVMGGPNQGFYFNGQKQGGTNGTVALAGTLTRILLGASALGSAANMWVDDFRMWSLARSVDDIRRDMLMDDYPAGTPGLIGQYRFSNKTNPGIDDSGNGLNLSFASDAAVAVATVSDDDTRAANLNRLVILAQKTPPGWEIPGAAWIPAATEANRNYVDIACSQDGNRIIAASSGGGGTLVISTNAGAAWSLVNPGGGAVSNWLGVACSGDAQIMAAVAYASAIWVSADGGATWTSRASSQAWSSITVSADGRRMAATVQGGSLYVSSDFGATWSTRDTLRNWAAVASSADGSNLVAAVQNGYLYVSTNAGASWAAHDTNRNWDSVAISADGTSLFATVNGGQIYTSTNLGANWIARESNRAWKSITCSSDGNQVAAVVDGGFVYTSPDGGNFWVPQDPVRAWRAIASSADGTRLVAATSGSTLFIRVRTLAQYVYEPDSGLIRGTDGAYLSAGVNTNLSKVASPFPLRLILHGDSANVRLCQRVFVGRSAVSSNTVIATSESLLNPDQIGSARRLSVAHLPFTPDNTFWTAPGTFTSGSVLDFTVTLDYNDHASNPFLHTFHPDHDNLTADFQSVQPQGWESYGITRKIRLTLNNPGTDFQSLTSSQLTQSGVYEETIVLAGKAGATRNYRMAGSFTIQRISPIDTLTTQ